MIIIIVYSCVKCMFLSLEPKLKPRRKRVSEKVLPLTPKCDMGISKIRHATKGLETYNMGVNKVMTWDIATMYSL